MRKEKVIQVRITERLLERFEKALEEDGRTKSSVIEEAINKYCEEFEKR